MTEERFCPTCGERILNDPEQHFCMFCGSFCMPSGGQPNQAMPDEAGAYTAKEIKFCPYCRAEIITGLKYCGSCGKKLPKAPNTHALTETPKAVTAPQKADMFPPSTPTEDELLPEPDVPQPKVVQPAPPYTPLPQKKNNTLLILAVTAVVLSAVGFLGLVGLVFTMNNSGNKSSEYTAAEEYTPNHEKVEAEQSEDAYAKAVEAAPYAEAAPDTDWKTQYDFACERILTESDLVGMGSKELRIMRNWIFARHGYIFRTQELKDYFSRYPWYNPRYTDVSSMLSDVEIRNAEFIKRHEP